MISFHVWDNLTVCCTCLIESGLLQSASFWNVLSTFILLGFPNWSLIFFFSLFFSSLPLPPSTASPLYFYFLLDRAFPCPPPHPLSSAMGDVAAFRPIAPKTGGGAGGQPPLGSSVGAPAEDGRMKRASTACKECQKRRTRVITTNHRA